MPRYKRQTHMLDGRVPNVFSGVFGQEPGQRLIRALSSSVDRLFTDLHNRYMPQDTVTYRTCLDRVQTWDGAIISAEYAILKTHFPDMDDLLNLTFVDFIRSMRGGASRQVVVRVPPSTDLLRTFHNHVVRNKFFSSGKFFDLGPFDQRIVCMDCVRDAYYSFCNENHFDVMRLNTARSRPLPHRMKTAQESDSDSDVHPDDSVSQIQCSSNTHSRAHDEEPTSVALSSVNLTKHTSASARSIRATQTAAACKRHNTPSAEKSRRREPASEDVGNRSAAGTQEPEPASAVISSTGRSATIEHAKHARSDADSTTKIRDTPLDQTNVSYKSHKTTYHNNDDIEISSAVSIAKSLLSNHMRPSPKRSVSPARSYITQLTAHSDD